MRKTTRARASVVAGIGVLLLASYAAWQSVLQLLIFTQQGALSTAQTLLCSAKTLGLIAVVLANLIWLALRLRSRGWSPSVNSLWIASAAMLWGSWLVDRDLMVEPRLPLLAMTLSLLAAVAAMTA